MILIKLPIWALQWLLFWIPMKQNRIIIYSMKQRGYSCNLKYLNEYLKTRSAENYEILWVVPDAKHFVSYTVAKEEYEARLRTFFERIGI